MRNGYYGRRNDNIVVEYIRENKGSFIMGTFIVVLLVAWLTMDILPKHRAKQFFNELGKQPGFTILMDMNEYSETNDLFNLYGALNQYLSNMIDQAMGFKLFEGVNTDKGPIKAYDQVDIYSLDGKLITSAEYLAYYGATIGVDMGYHIISVRAPGRKLYEKSYKVYKSKVVIVKKQ